MRDSTAILYRGCYRDYDRDLLLVMQRIYRAGDDDVSATVTSREGDVAVAHWSVHVGVCGTWGPVVVSYWDLLIYYR